MRGVSVMTDRDLCAQIRGHAREIDRACNGAAPDWCAVGRHVNAMVALIVRDALSRKAGADAPDAINGNHTTGVAGGSPHGRPATPP